jgi:hypothetical protein
MIRFTSGIFSLRGMVLGQLKMQLEVEHGYAGSFFYRGFRRGSHATHKRLRGSHATHQTNRPYEELQLK